MKRYIYIMLFMMTLGCFCAGCLRQEKHEGHVYIDTNLIGVPKRQQEKGYSYPYIVIKSQNYEKDVVFL